MNVKKLVLLILIVTIIFIVAMAFKFKYELVKDPDTEKNKSLFQLDKVIYPSSKEPLKNPIDIAIGKKGEIYVTDSDHHRIQVFDRNGNPDFNFGEAGSKEGQLNYPVGAVIDNKGNVYIAELYNKRISVFSSKGNFKYSIEVTGTSGQKSIPTAIAIDKNNFLYIVDKTDNTVKKISSKGEVLLVIGGPGGEQGKFQYPLGLVVSEKGNIFVSDTGNSRIQVFNNEGVFIQDYSITGGPPSGITVSKEEKIFYTEPTTSRLMTIADDGKPSPLAGDSMTNDLEDLYFPEGIEIYKRKLILTDKGNNRLVIYHLGKIQN